MSAPYTRKRKRSSAIPMGTPVGKSDIVEAGKKFIETGLTMDEAKPMMNRRNDRITRLTGWAYLFSLAIAIVIIFLREDNWLIRFALVLIAAAGLFVLANVLSNFIFKGSISQIDEYNTENRRAENERKYGRYARY